MKISKSWLPTFVALGTTWGLSFFFIEKSLESFTPFGVAFLRIILGAATLLIFGLISGQGPVFDKSLWKHFFVMGLILNAFPFLMFSIAQEHIPSSIAGMLNATTPLFSFLFLTIFFKSEKVTSSQSLGLLVGFLGVLFLLDIGSPVLGNDAWGVLLILAATMGYGFSFPYAKRYLSKANLNPTSMAMTQLLCATLILLPFSLILEIKTAEIKLDSSISILILGAMGTGFAYIWNYSVIAKVGSTIASTVTYITPLVATIAGLVLLNESLDLLQFVGGILILLSAALVQKRIKIFKTL